MSEPVQELDWSAFAERIHRTSVQRRIPLVGAMATTYRCNLGCEHCYLQGCRGLDELACEEWQEIIDQVTRAGCLWLLITGGEPLMRPDFERIYRYAKKKGLLITVFTNGTLIDDALIDLWRELPPYAVEISLYGYTPQTYEAVTGSAEAHGACFEAVRRLDRASIPMRLKTMALRRNAHELDQLKRFCVELGVPFRFDAMVSAGLDRSRVPCSTRLSPRAAIGFELEDDRVERGWANFLKRHQQGLPPRRSLFSCGGGKNHFFIGPDGQLSLCLYDVPVHSLKQGTFAEGWNGPVRQRRESPLPGDHPCWGCRDHVFCDVCTPVARMETGSDLGWPRALCELGRMRSRAITSHLEGSTGDRDPLLLEKLHEG